MKYDKLTFTKAFEIATGIELATSAAKNIQQQEFFVGPSGGQEIEMKGFP